MKFINTSGSHSIYFKVQRTVGNVTMIINNAGVVSGKPILECSDASIQRTFDVNVIAHFWVRKTFFSLNLFLKCLYLDHKSIFTFDA